ncbi:MAG: ABC transporter permease subunit [Eubacteriales bacterium]|nr:ABC transporter permease subunit [Clostridiales bacterium]MDY2770241.1 ABC transporter permease subunit [Eubacteriales bacterium]
MLLPVMAFLVIFHILPMFGVIIAFEKFIPTRGFFGSEFVGLKYFQQMLKMSISWRIFRNTVVIAVWKIAMNMVVPITFSILLNEVRVEGFKRTAQTIIYLPHFLSWVVLAIPIMNIFAYDGVVNNIVRAFGGSPILFMSSNSWFRPILIMTDVWKEFGFGTIVYLAAITGIDPALYEAAVIDGATRGQRMLHVTLPGMLPTIVLLATRNLGNVLSAGFDQIFNLYSPAVYEVGDIIDTYVYRAGLLEMNYSLSTAVGLMKSAISIVLILTSNRLAYKLANYRIF